MAEWREEVARGAFGAWNAGGREMPEITHPRIVIRSPLTGSTHEGQEGMRRWMDEIDQQFDRWEIWIDEYRTSGEDLLLALGGVHLRGRASGVEFDQPAAWLLRFEDERVIEMRIFTEHDEALAAADSL